jgi:hypothetical protein
MDIAEQERLVAQIAWGCLWFADSDTSYILRPSTIAEQAKAARVYEAALRRAQADELLSDDEWIEAHISRGEWSIEEEEKMEALKKDIRTLKRGMLDYVYQTDKLETIRRAVRKAESVFSELAQRRQSLLLHSAEHFATMSQQRYLIGRVTLRVDESPLWPDELEFDAIEDHSLLDRLSRYFFDDSRLRDSVIRQLARSVAWRALWSSMTTCGCIFNGNPMEWSQNQKQLVYWSKVYDNVFESYDRPTDEVVNDDDLLDSWFLRQGDKSDERLTKKMADDILGVNNKKTKPGANTETFVITSREGAAKVYAMNDARGRIEIQMRQREMNKKGVMREQDFAVVQQELRIQAQQMLAEHVRKKS